MPTALKQSTRIAELSTPLGKDVLVLSRFDGSEGLGELFEFRIEASSNDADLPLKDLIGQTVSVAAKKISGGERYFTGIATEVQWLGVQDKLFSYRIIARPWLYLLSQRINSRIFNQMDVSQIIGAVLGEYGFDFEDKIGAFKPKLEYCVQYQESDLAFVQRLMEQHGITFYFKFTGQTHTLVLSEKGRFLPIEKGERAFVPLGQQYGRDKEHFHTFVPERRFTSGKTMLHDYDFKKPSTSLRVNSNGKTDFATGTLERYDTTGRYVEKADGQIYSDIQMDSARAADGRAHAAGDVLSAHAGDLVTLTDHPTPSLNKQYLVVRAYHSLIAETYRSGGGSGEENPYNGSYELLDAKVDFYPPLITPCPVIAGPQTGTVAGRGEIDCDEFGRILVNFHWEREGKQSMRCRVAQVWAGKNWGGIFIPRVGMEVLVQFIDGNPDRPVVVGTVYNGEHMPPYKLPDKNMVAGWKTESTPGGGGYNEFVFDDTKGNELIRMHAQKDHETKILNEERRTIGADRITNIGHDDKLFAKNDIHIKADHKITLEVGQSKIEIEMGSIKITSPIVSVDASTKFESSAGITSDHQAGGLMKLFAATININ